MLVTSRQCICAMHGCLSAQMRDCQQHVDSGAHWGFTDLCFARKCRRFALGIRLRKHLKQHMRLLTLALDLLLIVLALSSVE
jgi:hypothetical protein